MKNQQLSRRRFIEASSLLATGLVLSAPAITGAPSILKHYNKPNSLINGVQIGVITYSFRSMPDQSAEATLKYIVDSGISATELMGDPAESFAGMPTNPVDRRVFYTLIRKQREGGTLTEDEGKELTDLKTQMEAYHKAVAAWRLNAPMDKFEQLKKMFNEAGVSIYGFKPRAFEKDNTDAEIEYGFRAAKALGASHVTLEHPSDDAHTLKLGKMAEKYKIYVAYHGHEQQTPTFWDTALTQSKYNAINPDMGHYIAAGNDQPLEFLQKNYKRITSTHIKDRQNPDHGKGNLLWGKGDTPIAEILQLMSREKYKFPATVELEYDIPTGSDAVKEVGRCLEFCKQVLAKGKAK
ncbi:MAG: sugar phosphate isomerase/epimerase [Microscillaceae bacterium]|nr:sugar phosphate isomerase/epimerase [Microscillaceae bacterium]